MQPETQVVDVKPRKSLIVLIISVLMLAAAIIYFDTKLLTTLSRLRSRRIMETRRPMTAHR